MVCIEELSRGQVVFFEDSEPQHRYASKISACSEDEEEDSHHHPHRYPALLGLIPTVTLLYMAACDNLKSNSDVFVFALGILSYVIAMAFILSKTMDTVDLFVA